jgi:RNA-binding protein
VTRTPPRTRSKTRSPAAARSSARVEQARRIPKRITTNRNAPKPKRKASRPAAVVLPDTSPAPLLSPRRRRDLRGEAHSLQPLVQVGHEGVTSSVIDAVSRALRDHELIKVRLHEPEDKKRMAEQLASESRSALCGLVGHTVILFKPKPVSDEPPARPAEPARPARPRPNAWRAQR